MSGFTEANDIKIINAENGDAYGVMDISSKSLNAYGIVHGGLYFGLADNTAGACAASVGAKCVTLNGSINYIRSVSSGRIHSHGKVIHSGKSTLVVEVEITSDDNYLLAKGTFTMFNVG